MKLDTTTSAIDRIKTHTMTMQRVQNQKIKPSPKKVEDSKSSINKTVIIVSLIASLTLITLVIVALVFLK